jgi:hypothetical protein
LLLPSETANFERTEPPTRRSVAVLTTRKERYSTPETQPRQQKIHNIPLAADRGRGSQDEGMTPAEWDAAAFEQGAANSCSKSKGFISNVTKNEAALPAKRCRQSNEIYYAKDAVDRSSAL